MVAMPRTQGWDRDIRDGIRNEPWNLSGPNRPIKVRPRSAPQVRVASGYFTLGKFLVGRTPAQIEADLGLKRALLTEGAFIWRFSRPPRISEYEYELTAAFPGGLSFNPGHSDPDYGPGRGFLHQWSPKPGVNIPVRPRPIELLPGERLFHGDL
jgi:hypothetical protein